MIRIEYSNSLKHPIWIQVDPWACLYELWRGEEIAVEAESSAGDAACSIVEHDRSTRILTLLNCEEFYVLQNGRRLHWTECLSTCRVTNEEPSAAHGSSAG